MTDQRGDVQIGELMCKLQPEGMFRDTGVRGLRDIGRSLFPERTGFPGAPGLQNLASEDLPWASTSWAGGSGQRVIAADDDDSFRRFESSLSLDFANPGEMRLARRVSGLSSTGGSVTTVDGASFTGLVGNNGSATVVGTTLVLSDPGDGAKVDVSLGVQTYVMTLRGHAGPPPKILGTALSHLGNAGTPGQMDTVGQILERDNRDLTQGQVEITSNLDIAAAPGSGGISPLEGATIKLIVRKHSDNSVVASTQKFIASGSTDAAIKLSFHALDADNYDIQTKFEAKLGRVPLVTVNYIEINEHAGQVVSWSIKRGATVIASGTTDLDTNDGAVTVIGQATSLVPAATHTATLTAGQDMTRDLIVDSFTYEVVAMAEPRLLELGLDDRVWLTDQRGTSTAGVFYYNPNLAQWVNVGTSAVGGNNPEGRNAVAMAHSDKYEFIAFSNQILRASRPSTVAAHTGLLPAPDVLVGIAVGGNRLMALTESPVSGTRLFNFSLESNSPVNWGTTPAFSVGNLGYTPSDTALPQRMAATINGCIWFVNQGPDCFLYQWDGAAGVPTGKLPTGARGQAIVHANGISWLGASLTAIDSSGTLRHRPALFAVTDGLPSLTDVKLHKDEDVQTRIRMMQLESRDLWVLTETGRPGEARTMRLWRVSLSSPVGSFLMAEVPIDETGLDGEARGLAINFRDRFFTWSSGPVRRMDPDAYEGSGQVTSSRYSFGIPYPKHLQYVDVDAQIPAGTSVRVWRSFDDEEFAIIGTWTEPGAKAVEQPGSPVAGKRLAHRVELLTTDPNLTPIVYEVVAMAFTGRQRRQWELALWFGIEGGASMMGGQPTTPAEAIAYLQQLVDAEAITTFTPRYANSVDPPTYVVSLENLDRQYVKPEEAWVRLRLTERKAL